MFRALQAFRPSASTAVAAARTRSTAVRAFSLSSARLSGGHDEHHGPPQIYGPGQKDVETIPTDEEQATGLERLQLLGRMEGVDVFDMVPLDSSRLGTLAEPIKVPSYVSRQMPGFKRGLLTVLKKIVPRTSCWMHRLPCGFT